VRVEWDQEKAERNQREHGVSFSEAATCFDDPNGCYFRNEPPAVRSLRLPVATWTRLEEEAKATNTTVNALIARRIEGSG
jgi:uncharacterized DUF497 family protein